MKREAHGYSLKEAIKRGDVAPRDAIELIQRDPSPTARKFIDWARRYTPVVKETTDGQE